MTRHAEHCLVSVIDLSNECPERQGILLISGIIIVSTTGTLSIQGLKLTNQTLAVRAGSWLSAIKTA